MESDPKLQMYWRIIKSTRSNHDDSSQVTSHTDPLGRLTLFEIDSASGDVLSTTRVVGEIDDEINEETDDVTTSFTYTDGTGDLPAGLLLTMTDALGRVAEYAYYDDGGSVGR